MQGEEGTVVGGPFSVVENPVGGPFSVVEHLICAQVLDYPCSSLYGSLQLAM